MRAPLALLPAARAALANSAVAHAVVELETQLIELKRQLGQGFSAVEPDVASALTIANHYECTGSSSTPPPTFRRKRHGLGSSSRGLGGRAPRILGLTWVTGPARRAGGRCGRRG